MSLLTRKQPLSQAQLAEKLRLEKLQRAEMLRQEELAELRREQERRRRWAETESPEARRAAAEREQAELQEAERAERARRLQDAETARSKQFVADRDWATRRLEESRGALSSAQAGLQRAETIEERLEAAGKVIAAERLVQDDEAALARVNARNGTRGR